MGGLLAGIVTIVLTGIEGAMGLFHRIGDWFLPVIERHNRTLREAWTAHGVEARKEGDGLFVEFADLSAGLAASAAARATDDGERS